MQPRPKVKNPGKTFKRLIALIMKRYKVQFILVFVYHFFSVIQSFNHSVQTFCQRLGVRKFNSFNFFC